MCADPTATTRFRRGAGPRARRPSARRLAHRALDLQHLRAPAHVALLPGHLGSEERDHDLGCYFRADAAPAETEDVDRVVLDGLMRRVRVVDRRRAHAADLAGGDRHAGPGAADDDPALGAGVGDGT